MRNLYGILPYLDKAPVIGRENYVVGTKNIYWDPKWENYGEKRSYKSLFSGIYIYPLDLVVLDEDPSVINWIKSHDEKVYAGLQIIDYRAIAHNIEVSGGKAFYPTGVKDVFEERDIFNSDLFLAALKGHSYGKLEKVEGVLDLISMRYPFMLESLNIDDFTTNNISSDEEKSTVEVRLRSYFSGNYTTNRVPLLLGMSAVAKSALIKSLTKEFGYRLVDIRTAFMSRLDFEGLVQKIETGDGRIESLSCPMADLVEVTDPYIEFCEKVIPVLEERLNEETDDQTIAQLSVALEKFREGAKIPVLLFDEITRGEASVRQALTKILTDKEFMGMPMKRARVIAATNHTLGDDKLPEDMFLTNDDMEDVAFFDRFESIQVNIDSVTPSWLKWAEDSTDGRQNIHFEILDFLDTHKGMVYYLNPVYDVYDQTMDTNEVSATVYPNFRTWEMVSNYLYSSEGKGISKQTFASLIGKEVGELFFDFLINKGYSEKESDTDGLTRAVEEGMDNNIPTLLIAPSSIGKTARIRKATEDRGYSFLQVNLGQQDRLDLSGPPTKVSIDRYILGQKLNVGVDIKSEIEAIMEDIDLPRYVTIRAPKHDLVKEFQKAQQAGSKVVLFYDELNRVSNPSTMSSVFEAISDHKAFGINFNPDNVIIFAACNLGDNYDDASQLDPAISNRFATFRKREYDESDLKSFIDYMKDADFDQSLVSWFEEMSTEEALVIIRSIDRRTISMSAASTRGLEDFSKFLKDDGNNSFMKGSLLFAGAVEKKNVFDWVEKKNEKLTRQIFDEIGTRIDNWAALREEKLFNIEGKSFNAKDVVALYHEVSDSLKQDLTYYSRNEKSIENLLSVLMKIDSEVSSRRSDLTTFMLGMSSDKFLDYYNVRSGRVEGVIEIADLIDISMIAPFVNQEMNKINRLTDTEREAFAVVERVWDYYGETFSESCCLELINSLLEVLINPETKEKFLWYVTMKTGTLDTYIEKCEEVDSEFDNRVLNKMLGKGVTIEKSSGSGYKPVVLG